MCFDCEFISSETVSWETCGSWVEVQLPRAGAFAGQLSGIAESPRGISKADCHWPETTFYVGLHIFSFSDLVV